MSFVLKERSLEEKVNKLILDVSLLKVLVAKLEKQMEEAKVTPWEAKTE